MPAADRQSFLNAIRAAPADDAPRLVYADWLDDRGDADQAEFIRGQIALATLETGDDGHTQLEIRCRELLRLHGEEWLGDLARFVGLDQLEDPVWPVFRRGLPERITVSGSTFLDHHERLLRGTVTGVRLTPGGRSTERLFFVDGWHRISAAGFVGHRDLFEDHTPPWWWREEMHDEPWRAPPHYFKDNARLDGLTELRLDFELPDGEDWAAALATTRFGARLESLAATSGGAPTGLDRLTALRRLELTGGSEDYGFGERTSAPWAGQLTHLRLNGFNLEHGGADGIAKIPNLKSFTLTDGRVTDWLSNGVGANFWTHAAFTDNNVRSDNVTQLLRAEPLGLLGSLDFSRNRGLLNSGPIAVTRSPFRETLRALKINTLGRAVSQFEDAPATAGMPCLERLEMNEVGTATAARRLLSDKLPRLIALRLYDAGVDAEGITDRGGACRLQDLRLDVPLSRVAARRLAESKNLDNLRLLDVTTDDSATVAILRQRWGKRVRVHS